jgi:hypothetical protein
MATKKIDFAKTLQQCEAIVREMGLVVNYTTNFDPFFKGDLDGMNIFIGSHLSAEEKLFNLLHLAGHSIQWNIDPFLRNLGSELYLNPDDALLKRLQTYEWQANCYAVSILHKANIFKLDKWLSRKYIIDMLYLTHFYKTGQKLKSITQVARAYVFNKDLEATAIPSFVPVAEKKTRNGLVIAF